MIILCFINLEWRDEEVVMDNDYGFWWDVDGIFFNVVERFENIFD